MNAEQPHSLLPRLVVLAVVAGSLGPVGECAVAGPLVRLHAGFEKGLSKPWGTGQFAAGRTTWWTSGSCDSTATIDRKWKHGGSASLHIVNRSARGAGVYGTTQRPFAIEPGRRYRIVVWARAEGLASTGAVSLVVDSKWSVRPIHLPKGTFNWAPLTGVFSLPESTAQLRILSEDRGEAWLDDITIFPEPSPGSGDRTLPPFVDGFDRGLPSPWGTGHYSEGHTVWWTPNWCQSSATPDRTIRKSGTASLHIRNHSPRAPNVYGTTQRPVRIVPGRKYRVSVWVRANNLKSDGGVSILVDRKWIVRPVSLPRGTYDWMPLTGVFSLPDSTAQLRILNEDAGEVWLDDLRIEPIRDPVRGTVVARTSGDRESASADGVPSTGERMSAVTIGRIPRHDGGNDRANDRSKEDGLALSDLTGVWDAAFLSMEMMADGEPCRLDPAKAPSFRFQISRRNDGYMFQVLDRPGKERPIRPTDDGFQAVSQAGKPSLHLVPRGATLYGFMTAQKRSDWSVEFHAKRSESQR